MKDDDCEFEVGQKVEFDHMHYTLTGTIIKINRHQFSNSLSCYRSVEIMPDTTSNMVISINITLFPKRVRPLKMNVK